MTCGLRGVGCGTCRVYGGIHFKHSTLNGLQVGYEVSSFTSIFVSEALNKIHKCLETKFYRGATSLKRWVHISPTKQVRLINPAFLPSFHSSSFIQILSSHLPSFLPFAFLRSSFTIIHHMFKWALIDSGYYYYVFQRKAGTHTRIDE